MGNLIYLRCTGVVGDEQVFVRLPVDRGLWDGSGEQEREDLRHRARRELQAFAHREAGVVLSGAYVASLPVEVEDPQDDVAIPPVTECETEFVGGPEDGTRMTWKGERPPPLIRLPVQQSPSVLLDDLDAPHQKLPIAEYGPITDELGFCSRSDDGAWRYEYQGQ
ncbi:hypothetical protein [Streptomyces malaysiensis]